MPGRTKVYLWLSCLCLAVFPSATARGQAVYLCLDTNSSNFSPAQYKSCDSSNASLISSFSFGVSSSVRVGTGIAASAPEVSNLTLTKVVNGTTPKLLRSLLARSGTPLGNYLVIGIIAKAPSGDSVPQNNITIVLHNPIVTSVEQTGINGGILQEFVTISFKQIEVIDNTVSPPTTITWTVP